MFLFACPKRNQKGTRGLPSMNTRLAPVFIGVDPYPLWPFGPSPPDRGSRPLDPRLRGTPSWFLGQSRPAGIVVAKSALFRTPKHGHPSCRFLAPPPPTEPALLGFGGDPNNEPVLLVPGTQAPTKWKFGSIRAVRTPPSLAKPWQLGSCGDICPTTAAPNR